MGWGDNLFDAIRTLSIWLAMTALYHLAKMAAEGPRMSGARTVGTFKIIIIASILAWALVHNDQEVNLSGFMKYFLIVFMPMESGFLLEFKDEK
jgi:hypothetical protein